MNPFTGAAYSDALGRVMQALVQGRKWGLDYETMLREIARQERAQALQERRQEMQERETVSQAELRGAEAGYQTERTAGAAAEREFQTQFRNRALPILERWQGRTSPALPTVGGPSAAPSLPYGPPGPQAPSRPLEPAGGMGPLGDLATVAAALGLPGLVSAGAPEPTLPRDITLPVPGAAPITLGAGWPTNVLPSYTGGILGIERTKLSASAALQRYQMAMAERDLTRRGQIAESMISEGRQKIQYGMDNEDEASVREGEQLQAYGQAILFSVLRESGGTAAGTLAGAPAVPAQPAPGAGPLAPFQPGWGAQLPQGTSRLGPLPRRATRPIPVGGYEGRRIRLKGEQDRITKGVPAAAAEPAAPKPLTLQQQIKEAKADLNTARDNLRAARTAQLSALDPIRSAGLTSEAAAAFAQDVKEAEQELQTAQTRLNTLRDMPAERTPQQRARAQVAGRPSVYVANQKAEYSKRGLPFNREAVRRVLILAGVKEPDRFLPRK